MELPNGSIFMAVSSSVDVFRGWAPTYILMDEAAFINKNDILFETTFTTLALGGSLMMSSTPNGVDKLFHKTFTEAISGKNTFNVIDLKWWEDERFNKDVVWILEKDTNIIDSLTDVNPKYYETLISSGYKPTNSWYEQMCRLLNYNDKAISQEIGGNFVI